VSVVKVRHTIQTRKPAICSQEGRLRCCCVWVSLAVQELGDPQHSRPELHAEADRESEDRLLIETCATKKSLDREPPQVRSCDLIPPGYPTVVLSHTRVGRLIRGR
jgi:hypothetical protein